MSPKPISAKRKQVLSAGSAAALGVAVGFVTNLITNGWTWPLAAAFVVLVLAYVVVSGRQAGPDRSRSRIPQLVPATDQRVVNRDALVDEMVRLVLASPGKQPGPVTAAWGLADLARPRLPASSPGGRRWCDDSAVASCG